MILVKIVLAITALAEFSLSALILFKARRSQANKSMGACIFFLAMWASCTLIFLHAPSLFWKKAAVVFVQPIAPLFFLFAQQFPYPRKDSSFWQWWYIWISSFIALVFSSTNLLVQSIAVRDGAIVPSYGILFYLLACFNLLLISASLWTLAQKHKKLGPIYKLQVKYIGLGSILVLLTAVPVTVSLPLLGIHDFGTSSAMFGLIFVAFTTYAIFKYRLADIQRFIIRSMIYIGFIVAAAITYGLIVVRLAIYLESMLNIRASIIYAIVGYSFVFSWPYVRKSLEEWTDKVFFRGRYDHQEFIKRVGAVCSSALSTEDLANRLMEVICEEMRLPRSTLAIIDSANEKNTKVFGSSISLNLTQSIIKKLKGMKIILTGELDEDDETKRNLEQNQIALIVPLAAEDSLVGFIALKEKLAGTAFTVEDIELLEIIEKEIVVAVQNSQFYEEIQGFNKRLRREVGKATTELRVANEDLQKLDKAKDEFISIASHELRAPLTAIRGFISLARESAQESLNTEQQECLEMATKSAEKLLNLINDMLTISNIEEDLTPNAMEFPLEEVIQQVIEEEKRQAERKGLSLYYQRPKYLIPLVKGDPDKIKSALVNLVNNAISYTEKGSVSIEVFKENGEVVVSVKDTGIGISEEDLPKLFSRFERGNRAKRILAEGSGLGLYIVKRIIEAHNGQIWVKSKEGEGSTFTFSLSLN